MSSTSRLLAFHVAPNLTGFKLKFLAFRPQDILLVSFFFLKKTLSNHFFLFQAKELGLGGDIKGDWYQYGGCIVVEAGGERTLLTYMQKEAPDHVENEEVLKALNIQLDPVPHAAKVG